CFSPGRRRLGSTCRRLGPTRRRVGPTRRRICLLARNVPGRWPFRLFRGTSSTHHSQQRRRGSADHHALISSHTPHTPNSFLNSESTIIPYYRCTARRAGPEIEVALSWVKPGVLDPGVSVLLLPAHLIPQRLLYVRRAAE